MKNIRLLIIGLTGLIIYTVILTGLSRVVFRDYPKSERTFGAFVPRLIYGSSEVLKISRSVFEDDEFYVENGTNKDGFEYYAPCDFDFKLLVSYKTKRNRDVIQLLDVGSGKLIKEWIPDSKQIDVLSFNPDNPRKREKTSDLNLRHPIMLSDSSIVIGSEYSLLRIGKDNEIIWLNNLIEAHHSIEQNRKGELFVTGRNILSNQYDFLPFEKEVYDRYLYDDTIDKVDAETGELIYSKSIIDILVENGYEDLLKKDGFMISDPIHLNDIQPAMSTTEYWEEDDLLVSCKNLSLVFLYRPSTNKIIWLQQGPWLNQHDVDFLDEDKIVVFGNDIFEFRKIDSYNLHEIISDCYTNNDLYIVNLRDGQISKPYSKLFADNAINTIGQGRSQILPNGDLFIEETDENKIIIGDTISKKIEFVRRLDDEHITYLNWSRIIF